MTPHFDFSEVPYSFGCAPPKTARKPQPACAGLPCSMLLSTEFPADDEPNRIIAGKGKCDYYCSNEKTRFALGFTRTANALTVRMASTFRYRMISYFGRKNYYLKRRGALKITPAEQIYVINVAKELGVVLNDYFDGYIEEYNWNA